MASKPQIGANPEGEVFKPVHRRRGTTKARTGCYCCKIRRVKCDETKPYCQRCIKFGIKCDGYPSSIRPKKLKTANSKIDAVPSTAVTTLARKRGLSGTYPEILPAPYAPGAFPKLVPSPSSPLKFADEIEERNFRTFQTETAAELTGLFETGFWDGLLLQACLEEPFTQKVVMAIAAMSTSKKLSHRMDADQAYRSIVPQQAEFAYRQYQKALKEMRTSLEKDGDSRKALIGCLLVVCFESLVGNVASAHANAISGLKLVELWLAQNPYKKLDEVGIKSPASHLLEDDILQAALFFDAQVSSYLDPRPAAVHAKLRHEGDITIKNMPAKFQTLAEAHRWAYLIFRRYVHSAHEIAELAGDGRLSSPSSSDYSIIEDGISGMSLNSVEEPRPNTSGSKPNDPSQDFTPLQRQCAEEMRAFRSAFDELYEETQVSGSPRDQAAAHSMLAMCVSFDICLAQILDTDNCGCDHLTAEFQQINSLLRKVILYEKAQNPSREFSFDFNVNQALFCPARLCRDRKIRREAIDLMRLYNITEGYHDHRYIIAMCQLAMELEEEGVETDFIPGSKRIRFIEETQHPGQRWSTVHYLRGFEDKTMYKAEFRW